VEEPGSEHGRLGGVLGSKGEAGLPAIEVRAAASVPEADQGTR
jgi:hypothetical protein